MLVVGAIAERESSRLPAAAVDLLVTLRQVLLQCLMLEKIHAGYARQILHMITVLRVVISRSFIFCDIVLSTYVRSCHFVDQWQKVKDEMFCFLFQEFTVASLQCGLFKKLLNIRMQANCGV